MVKAVFLDIDGTLMDTNYLHVEAWAQAFEEVGARPPRSRIHHEVGKGSDKLIPKFVEDGKAERVSELTDDSRYVIDVSRNGQGWRGTWCNPEGAGLGQDPGVVGTGDAGLGHPHHARGHLRGHPHGPGGVDLEGDEVALVHPDEVGTGGHRPIELGLVVDLDQHVEAEAATQPEEGGQLVVVEGGGTVEIDTLTHPSALGRLAESGGVTLFGNGGDIDLSVQAA